jgi:molecular chaperone HscB
VTSGAIGPDYFALLGFPRAFDLDEKAVHRVYLAAQRAAHPDRQNDPSARMAALQASADINQAYQILKDPLQRAEHLLALEGITVGSEKDSVRPSSVLLMESMDMRERLMEAKSSADVEALQAEARQLREATRAAFSRYYSVAQHQAAAQEAIRWRFLEKFLEEVRVRNNTFL